MRRLLVVALLLAGLCAPPAVLAQVGTPGVSPGGSQSVSATNGCSTTWGYSFLGARASGLCRNTNGTTQVGASSTNYVSTNPTTGSISLTGNGTTAAFSFNGNVTSGANSGSYALMTYAPTQTNFSQGHTTATFNNVRGQTMTSSSTGFSMQDYGTATQLGGGGEVGWIKNVTARNVGLGSSSSEIFRPLTGQFHTWFGQLVKKDFNSNTDQFSSGFYGGYWGDGNPSGASQWSAQVSNMNPAHIGIQTARVDVYVDHSNGSGAYASLEVSGQGLRVKERARGETQNPLGISYTRQYDGAWEAFVPGDGFALAGGSPQPSPADFGITPEPINVLVTDTTDSVNAGDIWVCGKIVTQYSPITCEALSLVGLPSPGPTTLTTVNSYVYIYSIKAVGAGVLGGAGDEVVSAEWATSVSPLWPAPVDLVNHASKGTFTISNAYGNYYEANCEDPNGCDVAIGAGAAGAVMTLVGAAGTYDILATDAATLQLAGGANFTIQPADTLQLIYSPSNTAYVEVSRSNN